MIGLVLGLIDAHSVQGDWFDPLVAYPIAGCALGLRHGGRAWQAWLPLGSSLYLMHRAAMACGYQPPYVEADAQAALGTFFIAWPVGVALALGALVPLALSWFPRPQASRSGPGSSNLDETDFASRGASPVVDPALDSSRRSAAISSAGRAARRLTVRKLMGIVLVIGIHLPFVRLVLQNDALFGFSTTYSERYSEGRFNALRVGMTTDEVQAIIGPPLSKAPWNQSAGTQKEEMWFYSSRPDVTANYWRRSILVQGGKVIDVIDDFWVD